MKMTYCHLVILFCLTTACVLVTSLPTLRPLKSDASIPNSINSLEEEHVQRAMVDVAATIIEVQKILETDPSLPRLTRGEIEELFENVTREEFEKSLQSGDSDRARHMKALMLVLPYSTNNASDARLQELYTRPPITKVVSSEKKPQKPQKIVISSENINGKTKTDPTTYNPGFQKPTTFHPRSSNTPASSTKPPEVSTEKGEKINNHYSAERPSFPNIPQRAPIRENVKDLLATIGLTQEVLPTTTKKPEITPELRELLESFGLLTNEEPPKHLQFDLEPIQEEFQPIPTKLIRDQPLVIEEPQTPVPTTYKRSSYRMNTAPEVTANDFYAFKPLRIPDKTQVTNDMQEFLRSYGLIDGNSRNRKSMSQEDPLVITAPSTTPKLKEEKMEKMPEVSVDFLTPDLLGVLGKIGIQNRAFDTAEISQKTERDSRKIKSSSKSQTNSITDDEKGQLNLLLDTIKHLEYINANLTDDELDAFYKKLASLDPVKGADNFGLIKNEIKRQSPESTTDNSSPIRITLDLKATTEENSDAETDNSSLPLLPQVIANQTEENDIKLSAGSETTSISTEKTTTTTEESKNSLNLEESFSGELDPVTEILLPSPRPNGFYFLADWNSFLEVGEDPDKVVVRFDPKIGDPSRFIPVHIP